VAITNCLAFGCDLTRSEAAYEAVVLVFPAVVCSSRDEQRIADRFARAVYGEGKKLAVPLHPCSATIEALTGESTVARGAPILFHHPHAAPVKGRELAIID